MFKRGKKIRRVLFLGIARVFLIVFVGAVAAEGDDQPQSTLRDEVRVRLSDALRTMRAGETADSFLSRAGVTKRDIDAVMMTEAFHPRRVGRFDGLEKLFPQESWAQFRQHARQIDAERNPQLPQRRNSFSDFESIRQRFVGSGRRPVRSGIARSVSVDRQETRIAARPQGRVSALRLRRRVGTYARRPSSVQRVIPSRRRLAPPARRRIRVY